MDQLLRAQSLQSGANDVLAIPTAWPIFVAAVEKMLQTPYLVQADRDAVAVTRVEGRTENSFWLYCPELDLCLSGGGLEELRGAMTERIRAAMAAGQVLHYVSHVSVSGHLVTAAPRPTAAHRSAA